MDHLYSWEMMKTFKIDLPPGSAYEYLCWKEDLDTSRECFRDYTTVWVDIDKLVYYAESKSNIAMVSSVDAWSSDKRDHYIKGVNPHDDVGLLSTPRVFFHDYEEELVERRFFGFRQKIRIVKIQYAGFVNGRHRTRIAQYLGAKKIPVQTSKDNVEVLLKFCSPND
nr:hypothetical protein BCS90_23595 [Vibrio cyclitrophicus]